MNIVQVSGGELRIPVEKGGGMEETVVGISKHLCKAGHSVTILDRQYSRNDCSIEYLDDVKIVRLKAFKFSRFSFTIRFVLNQITFTSSVKKYLAKNDFDVIQVNTSITGIILALTARNISNRIFYLSQASRRTDRSPGIIDRMAIALENQLVKRINKTIVQNELVKEHLISEVGIKPESIVATTTGVDTSKFTPDIDPGNIKLRYELEGKSIILFVGAIDERKGVEYLVEAANIVVNEFGHKDALFILAGPIGGFSAKAGTHTPYLSKIMRLIEDYGLQGNVKLTGALLSEELSQLRVSCDIFAFPSLAEAMPTAPLEAMASAKPVVATRVGGIPNEILDRENGFLVDPANDRQLAEKIAYLIDNPTEAKRMGALGRKIAEEQFDWANIAEKFLQVYQSDTKAYARGIA